MDTPHPERGEGLALHLAKPAIKPGGALEVGELTRILDTVHDEAGVRDPSPSDGEVRLGRIKISFGEVKSRRVTPERRQFVSFGGPEHAVVCHLGTLERAHGPSH